MAEKKDGQGSTYSVIQDLGDLSKPTKKGEQKRVSICDYKGELRLDIRRWSTGGTMLKGISLSMRTRCADCGTFSTTLTSAICNKKKSVPALPTPERKADTLNRTTPHDRIGSTLPFYYNKTC